MFIGCLWVWNQMRSAMGFYNTNNFFKVTSHCLITAALLPALYLGAKISRMEHVGHHPYQHVQGDHARLDADAHLEVILAEADVSRYGWIDIDFNKFLLLSLYEVCPLIWGWI